SGALSRCWGLLDRKARVPDDDELATARRSRGWERVRLDTQARTIAFDAPGIELNLGSLGKGYALDRCASRLQDAGILDFLIQAGGSTILARGHAADGLGWPITLPRAGSARREVLLLDEALSTSGSSEQTYMLNGQHLGHIIDPREGRPSERTGVVSAIARSGALAEAVSTALFLMDDASASRLLSATGARRCA
ncbi:MAG: FAD:protein FMN transferase, partial [Vicinamibacteria bacterium]|nr:FAD:protein FMN transferase [Vicinamibacteria bacterium]